MLAAVPTWLMLASVSAARAQDEAREGAPATQEVAPAEPAPAVRVVEGPVAPRPSAEEAAARYAELSLRLLPGPGIQVVDGRGRPVDAWTLAVTANDVPLWRSLRQQEQRGAAWSKGIVLAGLGIGAAGLVPLAWVDRSVEEVSQGYGRPQLENDVNLAAGVGLLTAGAALVLHGAVRPPRPTPTIAQVCTREQVERDIALANAALRRQLGLAALADAP